jgi:hypothetical protein
MRIFMASDDYEIFKVADGNGYGEKAGPIGEGLGPFPILSRALSLQLLQTEIPSAWCKGQNPPGRSNSLAAGL